MAKLIGRPRSIFVAKTTKITPVLIPNKVLQEQAVRNGWSDAKILKVAKKEGLEILSQEAIRTKVKADAIPCERCDMPLKADNVNFLPDGSLAHMYDCVT